MLQACLGGAVPAETLSATVGHSSRTGHFKRWLKSLLAEGFLEMTVPDKPTSPAQQYRLMDKGRAAIAFDGDEQTRGEAEDEGGGHAGGQAEGQAALSAKEIAMFQASLDDPVRATAAAIVIGVLTPFPSQYLAKNRQLKIGVSAVSKTSEMTNRRTRILPICSQLTFRPVTLPPPPFDVCG